jgi:hypothetical protein
MEEWYRQQEFFNEIRLQRLKAWMEQEVIDLHAYSGPNMNPRFAV